MSLERGGVQAQFINRLPPTPDSDTLGPTLRWLEENCGRPLTLADIATHAAMSNRAVSRRFQDHLGTSPMRWPVAIPALVFMTNGPPNATGSRIGSPL